MASKLSLANNVGASESPENKPARQGLRTQTKGDPTNLSPAQQPSIACLNTPLPPSTAPSPRCSLAHLSAGAHSVLSDANAPSPCSAEDWLLQLQDHSSIKPAMPKESNS